MVCAPGAPALPDGRIIIFKLDSVWRLFRNGFSRAYPGGPSRKETGDTGEILAEGMLKGSGYKILERNFLIRGGEIDLIAWRKGMLVFVEVKTRRGRVYGSPAEAVDLKKRKRLEKAAKVFLLRYGDSQPACRFDLIEVGMGPGERVKINQIKDAFRPGWEVS